ncbi:hypothetical protein CDIK_0743 [Cucumispora dikerogammari]|nr:hypothetical protein CDIK_0743 [Cucumispora dikerogammari]
MSKAFNSKKLQMFLLFITLIINVKTSFTQSEIVKLKHLIKDANFINLSKIEETKETPYRFNSVLNAEVWELPKQFVETTIKKNVEPDIPFLLIPLCGIRNIIDKHVSYDSFSYSSLNNIYKTNGLQNCAFYNFGAVGAAYYIVKNLKINGIYIFSRPRSQGATISSGCLIFPHESSNDSKLYIGVFFEKVFYSISAGVCSLYQYMINQFQQNEPNYHPLRIELFLDISELKRQEIVVSGRRKLDQNGRYGLDPRRRSTGSIVSDITIVLESYLDLLRQPSFYINIYTGETKIDDLFMTIYKTSDTQ